MFGGNPGRRVRSSQPNDAHCLPTTALPRILRIGEEEEDLAMDALTNLVTNIPDWQLRLDELNGKIAQRQIELAKLTGHRSSTSSCNGSLPSVAKSVRNKGSTESLRPPDEPSAHPREITPQPETAPQPSAIVTTESEQIQTPNKQNEAPVSPAGSQSPSAIQRQASQMRAAGQARARATLRKRQRTDSVASAEGQTPKYRTRSMIIVYYDSYVQSFFEELVKFVSASRNMMRKAKMAAKVAQIKRLAEMEMPDDSDEDGDDTGDPTTTRSAATATAALTDQSTNTDLKVAAAASAPLTADTALEAGTGTDGEDEMPALRFVSTRRMPPTVVRTHNLLTQSSAGRGMYARTGGPRSYGRGPTSGDPPDVYDELDKGLEYVQSMCEHAAHQFLRDGDCAEEVANIQRRMGETRELADKEMARVKKEEPEALKAAQEALRGRSYRPQSMRKAGAGMGGASAAVLAAKGAEVTSASNGADPAPAAARAADSGLGNDGNVPPFAGLSAAASGNALEVDEGVEDMDYDNVLPKLVYKSTRRMMG